MESTTMGIKTDRDSHSADLICRVTDMARSTDNLYYRLKKVGDRIYGPDPQPPPRPNNPEKKQIEAFLPEIQATLATIEDLLEAINIEIIRLENFA